MAWRAAMMLALLAAFAPAHAAPAPPAKLPAKLKVGDLAPQFVRTDMQGQAFDLHATRGKIVLIDFWASWCPPCIIEIPHLNALEKKFGPQGLRIVGVSMDDFAAVTRQTMARISFAYPVVQGDAKFGNLFGGVLGLPRQYLVGGDGRILVIWDGEVPPAALDKAILAALQKNRTKP